MRSSIIAAQINEQPRRTSEYFPSERASSAVLSSGGEKEGKKWKKEKKRNNRGIVSNVAYDPFRAARIR